MDAIPKIVEAVVVLFTGLASGYLTRRQGWLPAAAAEPLTRWLLAHVTPVVTVLTLWSLPVED